MWDKSSIARRLFFSATTSIHIPLPHRGHARHGGYCKLLTDVHLGNKKTGLLCRATAANVKKLSAWETTYVEETKSIRKHRWTKTWGRGRNTDNGAIMCNWSFHRTSPCSHPGSWWCWWHDIDVDLINDMLISSTGPLTDLTDLQPPVSSDTPI